jgi:hypothetical protein
MGNVHYKKEDKRSNMKSKILLISSIILFSTVAWAADFVPPGHRYDVEKQHNIDIRNTNTAIGTGGNAGAIANAPTTINVGGTPVYQGVTIAPTPLVVQESQKVAPTTLPFINQANPPYLQPPTETAQTRAPGVKPWNVAASHWKNEVWPVRLIKEPKSRSGIQVIKPTSGQQFPVGEKNLKRGSEPVLTIYKGDVKAKEWSMHHVIDRVIYKATSADITLMQLQDAAMWDAVQAGATGLKVNQETYVLRSAQKGGDIRAMLGLSQLGSALGLPMLFGGGIEGGYLNYEAMMDAYPVLDVEQVQVQ